MLRPGASGFRQRSLEDTSMSGIDPYGYMQQVSSRLPELKARDEIETVLDELEFMFEVVPPELQDDAEQLITVLRQKLAAAPHT